MGDITNEAGGCSLFNLLVVEGVGATKGVDVEDGVGCAAGGRVFGVGGMGG